MLRETLEDLGCYLSEEKHVRIVLAMEGLEGPNTQDKAERFMAVRQLFEDTIATCHPHGVLHRRLANHCQHQWAFQQLWKKIRCGLRRQCAHDFRRC